MAKKKTKAEGPKMVAPKVREGFVPMAYPSGKFYGNVPEDRAQQYVAQGLVRLKEPPQVPAE